MPNSLAQLFIREPGQTRETEIKARVKTADIRPGTIFGLRRKAGKLRVVDEKGKLIGEILKEPIKTKTIKILKSKKGVKAIVQSAKRGKIKLVLRAEEPLYGNHEIEYKPYLKQGPNNEKESLELPLPDNEDEIVSPEEKSPTGYLTITETPGGSETQEEPVEEMEEE